MILLSSSLFLKVPNRSLILITSSLSLPSTSKARSPGQSGGCADALSGELRSVCSVVRYFSAPSTAIRGRMYTVEVRSSSTVPGSPSAYLVSSRSASCSAASVPVTSPACVLASCQNAGLVSCAPVALTVSVNSQSSRPSGLAPMLSSAHTSGCASAHPRMSASISAYVW